MTIVIGCSEKIDLTDWKDLVRKDRHLDVVSAHTGISVDLLREDIRRNAETPLGPRQIQTQIKGSHRA